MELCDYSNIIPKGMLTIVLEAHGWIYKDSLSYLNYTLMKPDFYPSGFVLALSKKAVIICDGISLIKYNGSEYSDIEEMIEQHGKDIIETFSQWEFEIEKEWTVMKNGQYVHSFTSFDQITERKKLRC